MKALGTLFWMARRFTWESGVCGIVVIVPATRGKSLGSDL